MSEGDVSLIKDEDVLRKMWQKTEDFGKKKEIRAHMYKLREERLKNFYASGEGVPETNTTQVNKAKGCEFTTSQGHTQSFADQSFQSIKSKEVRDAGSPPRDFSFKSRELKDNSTAGWTVESENKVSDDGHTRSKVIQSEVAGQFEADGGTGHFAAVDKQKQSVTEQSDANSNYKKSENSSASAAQEHFVKQTDDGSMTSSVKSSSTSSRVQQSSRKEFVSNTEDEVDFSNIKSTINQGNTSQDTRDNKFSSHVDSNITTKQSKTSNYETSLRSTNNSKTMEHDLVSRKVEYPDENTKVTIETRALPDGTVVTSTRREIRGPAVQTSRSESKAHSESWTNNKKISSTNVTSNCQTENRSREIDNSDTSIHKDFTAIEDNRSNYERNKNQIDDRKSQNSEFIKHESKTDINRRTSNTSEDKKIRNEVQNPVLSSVPSENKTEKLQSNQVIGEKTEKIEDTKITEKTSRTQQQEYVTSYQSDYVQRKVSNEQSASHQAWASSLRADSPPMSRGGSIRSGSPPYRTHSSTSSLRSSISPDKASRRPNSRGGSPSKYDRYSPVRSGSPDKTSYMKSTISHSYKIDDRKDSIGSDKRAPSGYPHSLSPERRTPSKQNMDHVRSETNLYKTDTKTSNVTNKVTQSNEYINYKRTDTSDSEIRRTPQSPERKPTSSPDRKPKAGDSQFPSPTKYTQDELNKPRNSSSPTRKPTEQTYYPRGSPSPTRKSNEQTYKPKQSPSPTRKPTEKTYHPRSTPSPTRKPTEETYIPRSSPSKTPVGQTSYPRGSPSPTRQPNEETYHPRSSPSPTRKPVEKTYKPGSSPSPTRKPAENSFKPARTPSSADKPMQQSSYPRSSPSPTRKSVDTFGIPKTSLSPTRQPVDDSYKPRTTSTRTPIDDLNIPRTTPSPTRIPHGSPSPTRKPDDDSYPPRSSPSPTRKPDDDSYKPRDSTSPSGKPIHDSYVYRGSPSPTRKPVDDSNQPRDSPSPTKKPVDDSYIPRSSPSPTRKPVNGSNIPRRSPSPSRVKPRPDEHKRPQAHKVEQMQKNSRDYTSTYSTDVNYDSESETISLNTDTLRSTSTFDNRNSPLHSRETTPTRDELLRTERKYHSNVVEDTDTRTSRVPQSPERNVKPAQSPTKQSPSKPERQPSPNKYTTDTYRKVDTTSSTDSFNETHISSHTDTNRTSKLSRQSPVRDSKPEPSLPAKTDKGKNVGSNERRPKSPVQDSSTSPDKFGTYNKSKSKLIDTDFISTEKKTEEINRNIESTRKSSLNKENSRTRQKVLKTPTTSPTRKPVDTRSRDSSPTTSVSEIMYICSPRTKTVQHVTDIDDSEAIHTVCREENRTTSRRAEEERPKSLGIKKTESSKLPCRQPSPSTESPTKDSNPRSSLKRPSITDTKAISPSERPPSTFQVSPVTETKPYSDNQDESVVDNKKHKGKPPFIRSETYEERCRKILGMTDETTSTSKTEQSLSNVLTDRASRSPSRSLESDTDYSQKLSEFPSQRKSPSPDRSLPASELKTLDSSSLFISNEATREVNDRVTKSSRESTPSKYPRSYPSSRESSPSKSSVINAKLTDIISDTKTCSQIEDHIHDSYDNDYKSSSDLKTTTVYDDIIETSVDTQSIDEEFTLKESDELVETQRTCDVKDTPKKRTPMPKKSEPVKQKKPEDKAPSKPSSRNSSPIKKEPSRSSSQPDTGRPSFNRSVSPKKPVSNTYSSPDRKTQPLAPSDSKKSPTKLAGHKSFPNADIKTTPQKSIPRKAATSELPIAKKGMDLKKDSTSITKQQSFSKKVITKKTSTNLITSKKKTMITTNVDTDSDAEEEKVYIRDKPTTVQQKVDNKNTKPMSKPHANKENVVPKSAATNDLKMVRTTSDITMKTNKIKPMRMKSKPEISVTKSSIRQTSSSTARVPKSTTNKLDMRSPISKPKSATTLTGNLEDDVIIDIQQAKSSRENSPDRICPTPVSLIEETGKPRLPDEVSEPDDERYARRSVKTIHEAESFDENNIVELSDDEIMDDVQSCDDNGVSDTDECLLSVNDKVSKFLNTSEKKVNVGKYKTDIRIQNFNENLKSDECLLSVSEKVSKFTTAAKDSAKLNAREATGSPGPQDYDHDKIEYQDNYCKLSVNDKASLFVKTAEQVVAPIKMAPKIDRPDLTNVDESLKTDDCLLSVSDKVNKFVTTAEKLTVNTSTDKVDSARKTYSKKVNDVKSKYENLDERRDSYTKETVASHAKVKEPLTVKDHDKPERVPAVKLTTLRSSEAVKKAKALFENIATQKNEHKGTRLTDIGVYKNTKTDSTVALHPSPEDGTPVVTDSESEIDIEPNIQTDKLPYANGAFNRPVNHPSGKLYDTEERTPKKYAKSPERSFARSPERSFAKSPETTSEKVTNPRKNLLSRYPAPQTETVDTNIEKSTPREKSQPSLEALSNVKVTSTSGIEKTLEEVREVSRRGSGKFGVELRRTSVEHTALERRRSSVTEPHQPCIEDIFDVELLEQMLEKVVGYEQRRRIRAQIRIARKNAISTPTKHLRVTTETTDKSPDRRQGTSPSRLSVTSPSTRSGKSPDRRLAKSPEPQAKSPDHRVAKSPERKSLRSPERKPAKSPERRPAKSPERQTAKSPERRPAKSPERKPAKSPERKQNKSPERKIPKGSETKPAKTSQPVEKIITVNKDTPTSRQTSTPRRASPEKALKRAEVTESKLKSPAHQGSLEKKMRNKSPVKQVTQAAKVKSSKFNEYASAYMKKVGIDSLDVRGIAKKKRQQPEETVNTQNQIFTSTVNKVCGKEETVTITERKTSKDYTVEIIHLNGKRSPSPEPVKRVVSPFRQPQRLSPDRLHQRTPSPDLKRPRDQMTNGKEEIQTTFSNVKNKTSKFDIEKKTSHVKLTEAEKPSWVKNNGLRKTVLSETRSFTSKKVEPNDKSKYRSQSPSKVITKPTDVITSGYGLGPMDSDGKPLFGIKALRNGSKNYQVKGTVIRKEFHSENCGEPEGEISITAYSTEPEDLRKFLDDTEAENGTDKAPSEIRKALKERQENRLHGGVSSIKTTKKFGTSGNSISKIHEDRKAIEHSHHEKKNVRQSSVKSLTEKFIKSAVETTKSEKSSYPKAGLILRTNNIRDTTSSGSSGHGLARTDSDTSIGSNEHVTSSTHHTSSHSQQTHTDQSNTSFLDSRTKVTGVQDILSRMKNADIVIKEGDTCEDSEARALLNKFLGATVLMAGMEAYVTEKPQGKVQMRQEVKSNKTASRTSVPVDIENIWDERILRQLLEECTEYEQRRRIRARLRQVMAEQDACAQVVADAADEAEVSREEHVSEVTSVTSSTVKTESSKESVDVSTKTTKVIENVALQSPKQPVSPFAKFRQLEKQNSTSNPSSPSTPTSPTQPLFRFTDPALQASALTIKERLLQWCRDKTKEYENVKLDNFSTSWSDGLAFCALIHHFLPDAFDYSKLTPEKRRHNFTLAFKVADEKAGIYPLLDVDDMVAMRKPDWKCVFTYVQAIHRRFKDEV